jgi:hypothetical protein
LDGNKGADFGNGLDQLPLLKKINSCSKDTAKDSNLDQEVKNTIKKDNETMPLSVWVNKKTKRIAKIGFESTEKDKKDGVDGTGEVILTYDAVTVTKPTNAKPITSLLGELGSLFQSNRTEVPLNSDL